MKNKSLLLACALVFFILLSGYAFAVDVSDNLLKNHSFEEGIPPLGTSIIGSDPSKWAIRQFGGKVDIQWVDDGVDGSKALKVYGETDHSTTLKSKLADVYFFSDIVEDIEPGLYLFTMHYKTEGDGKTRILLYLASGGDFTAPAAHSWTVTNRGTNFTPIEVPEWSKWFHIYDVPEGTEGLSVAIRMYAALDESGTVWFDNIQLRKIGYEPVILEPDVFLKSVYYVPVVSLSKISWISVTIDGVEITDYVFSKANSTSSANPQTPNCGRIQFTLPRQFRTGSHTLVITVENEDGLTQAKFEI